MRIDPTIYAAIDAGTLTVEQIIASFIQAIVEATTANLIALGRFAEADVKAVVEEKAQLLRERSHPRLETLRMMLESRALSSQ